MTKAKKIILSTVISVFTLGGLVTYAMAGGSSCGKHGGMHGKKIERMVERMSSKLDLTSDQKTKLEAVKVMMQTNMEERRQQQRPAQAMMSLLGEDMLDQEKAIAMINERAQKMQDKAPEMIKTIAAFTDTLNAEQRAKVQKMMERFTKHRGMRGHHGKHHEKEQQQSAE